VKVCSEAQADSQPDTGLPQLLASPTVPSWVRQVPALCCMARWCPCADWPAGHARWVVAVLPLQPCSLGGWLIQFSILYLGTNFCGTESDTIS